MSQSKGRELAISGLLIAIAIMIPLLSPVKIILEPASFTLASHVPLFLAMFISPRVGISVALGATLGFALAGFPLVVVLRAASQIIYVTLGALYLRKRPLEAMSGGEQRILSFVLALIHAAAELVVVTVFYFTGVAGDSATLGPEFVRNVLFLVGAGTVMHSMFDFEIARFFALRLKIRGATADAKG